MMNNTQAEQTFYLVYPEKKIVTATKIMGWYSDAVANGECEAGALDAMTAAQLLEDAGLITIGTRFRGKMY